MNDTSAKMTPRIRAMITAKTPQERLTLGCSRYDFSKSLVKSAIFRQNPHLSHADMRCELFRKFYGRDFDRLRQEKILRHLKLR